jgi:hypothetical protein
MELIPVQLEVPKVDKEPDARFLYHGPSACAQKKKNPCAVARVAFIEGRAYALALASQYNLIIGRFNSDRDFHRLSRWI